MNSAPQRRWRYTPGDRYEAIMRTDGHKLVWQTWDHQTERYVYQDGTDEPRAFFSYQETVDWMLASTSGVGWPD